MSFVCDIVSAMDTRALQRFTWHPNIRGHPLAPPLIRTFATSLIYLIFHEAVMPYKGSVGQLCFSMIVAWCPIPNRSYRTHVCSDTTLNNSTPFLK